MEKGDDGEITVPFGTGRGRRKTQHQLYSYPYDEKSLGQEKKGRVHWKMYHRGEKKERND